MLKTRRVFAENYSYLYGGLVPLVLCVCRAFISSAHGWQRDTSGHSHRFRARGACFFLTMSSFFFPQSTQSTSVRPRLQHKVHNPMSTSTWDRAYYTRYNIHIRETAPTIQVHSSSSKTTPKTQRKPSTFVKLYPQPKDKMAKYKVHLLVTAPTTQNTQSNSARPRLQRFEFSCFSWNNNILWGQVSYYSIHVRHYWQRFYRNCTLLMT